MKKLQELFNQYRHNKQLMERLIGKLNGMERLTDTVKGSSAEWPFTQQTITVCGRNAAEEMEMMEEINQLKKKCKAVEDALRKAPNSRIRMTLEYKYVDGMSWNEVADAMKDNAGGEAMRKRAEKFFDSLEVDSGFSG